MERGTPPPSRPPRQPPPPPPPPLPPLSMPSSSIESQDLKEDKEEEEGVEGEKECLFECFDSKIIINNNIRRELVIAVRGKNGLQVMKMELDNNISKSSRTTVGRRSNMEIEPSTS